MMNVFGLWVDFIVTVKNNTDARKYIVCTKHAKLILKLVFIIKYSENSLLWVRLYSETSFHIHKLINEQNNKTLFLLGKKNPFKKSHIQNDFLRLVVLKVWSLDQHHLRTCYKYRFSGPTYTYWIRNWE